MCSQNGAIDMGQFLPIGWAKLPSFVWPIIRNWWKHYNTMGNPMCHVPKDSNLCLSSMKKIVSVCEQTAHTNWDFLILP
jgi:hypothetical protein